MNPELLPFLVLFAAALFVIDAGCFLWLRHNARPLGGMPVHAGSSSAGGQHTHARRHVHERHGVSDAGHE